jgi:hypothetical protein
MKLVTYEMVADEALAHYGWGLDPDRVGPALKLLTDYNAGTIVMPAQRDEFDFPANGQNLWIVRPTRGRGWYYVRPDAHSCTCKDSQLGHICKHRIAVYLILQQRKRTEEELEKDAKNYKPNPILKELGF